MARVGGVRRWRDHRRFPSRRIVGGAQRVPERGLSLRVTALLSLLAANRAALAGEALVARIAGNHEPAIAASSTACGLAVAAVSAGVGREGDHEGLVRAYALGFAPPFVLFVLLGAGLGAF